MEKIEERVVYSRWAVTVTIVVLVIFVALKFVKIGIDTTDRFWYCCVWSLRVLVLLLLGGGLYYGPVAVELDDRRLKIRRGWFPRKIAISDIARVEPHARTMTDVRKRICGSSGYMGYWGWFSSPSVGRYFAYVGRWSDAFLIELKSGRKYVVSCKDSDIIAGALIERLNAGCAGG